MQTITQTNVHVLIPHKVGVISQLISEETGMITKEAILHVYNSSMYARLENESSKLWHESGLQIFKNYFEGKNASYHNGAFKSKLHVHAERIFSLKQNGATLNEIAAALLLLGCKTTPQNISKFLKLHAPYSNTQSSIPQVAEDK